MTFFLLAQHFFSLEYYRGSSPGYLKAVYESLITTYSRYFILGQAPQELNSTGQFSSNTAQPEPEPGKTSDNVHSDRRPVNK